MLQRIQTLYLLFAAGCLLAMYFTPLALINLNDQTPTAVMHMYHVDGGAQISNAGFSYVAGVACILVVFTIFLFGKRKQQLKFVKFNILLLAISIALLALYWNNARSVALAIELKVGFYLPLPALMFNWLAARAISKDEALVKAADRIR